MNPPTLLRRYVPTVQRVLVDATPLIVTAISAVTAWVWGLT